MSIILGVFKVKLRYNVRRIDMITTVQARRMAMIGREQCDEYWAMSDLLPLDAILEYWCKTDECRQAKKHAMLTAIERGDIEYKRRDGKTYEDPIYQLYGNNNLLVDRESFLLWANKLSSGADVKKVSVALQGKVETTYLNTIAVLVEALQHQSANPVQKMTNTSIIDQIIKKYPSVPGLSKRSLEAKFAESKRSLKATS
ncbi:MAG: hypothetical protein HN790_12505 [Methylococcales bacterium]|nr:hypothetical protein [Methylococcales bacterium]